MQNKRGISGVILTILMIVLVLAAVVIIWGVITNLLKTQSEGISVNSKCLSVSIQATKLTCGGAQSDICNVTVSRTSTGGAIAGIKLVFTNAAGGTNYIKDVLGNVAPLETKTITNVTTGLANTDKVTVSAYFTDASGKEQLC